MRRLGVLPLLLATVTLAACGGSDDDGTSTTAATGTTAAQATDSFPVTVTALEPLGDLVRVRATAGARTLAADVTAHSVAALELAAGQQVTFTVKATEVAVYRL